MRRLGRGRTAKAEKDEGGREVTQLPPPPPRALKIGADTGVRLDDRNVSDMALRVEIMEAKGDSK